MAWVLYAGVRAILTIMQVFPLDWNLGTARLLARAWARITPRHRSRAEAHLALAFGEALTPAKRREVAHQSLESVTMFAVEAACLPRLINPFTWTRYVRLAQFEPVLKLLLSGRGVIMVTGHYGSFELPGHLLACLGFRMVAVMRPLDNVYLNRYIVATRRMHGLTLLDKKGAMTQAEEVLASGAILSFIGDQDAGRKGLFVDFFGQPASTYKSIALLAITTRTPVVVGYARRLEGRARYEIGAQRIIMPEEWETESDPVRYLTQAYTTAIEHSVRHAPEQYLWIHRRWKSRPKSKRNDVARQRTLTSNALSTVPER